MTRLKINLENCFGIKKLIQEFDFRNCKAQNIYAPNGFMKSSLAKVFTKLANNAIPEDEIYQDRVTICNITDESNNELSSESIFVIKPYDEEYKSKKISTLLVNQALKEEYENIHRSLDEKKINIIRLLNSSSQESKKKIESIILEDFEATGSTFFEVLERYKEQILDNSISIYQGLSYPVLFNDKVIAFLQKPGIQDSLDEYIRRYNILIDNSQFFRRGIFNHNNATNIAKTLNENGFFQAEHIVNLKKQHDETLTCISSADELSQTIENEKNAILNDTTLQTIFQRIDTEIIKNAELRNFRQMIEDNLHLIPLLANIDDLKRQFWISYLKEHQEVVAELLEEYEAARTRIAQILQTARDESYEWNEVVKIFKKRFIVPFELEIENTSSVVLQSTEPRIKFIYVDGNERKSIGNKQLVDLLSMGEKRALYILNLIFEIKAIQNSGIGTLLIIDDIADSFDYKNKYAIVEYLNEILATGQFYMLILTHNFDFFRTIHSRLRIKRDNCFMAMKKNDRVELEAGGYLNNVFKNWKNEIDTNQAILISSIPFVRNLAEYVLPDRSPEYSKLTSLLHVKTNTASITLADLEQIFIQILNKSYSFGSSNSVIDLIYAQADYISTLAENSKLENKIVLSIAIRLKAEEYMINRISNSTFVSAITANQTIELFKKFCQLFPNENENISLLGQVNLMTPENIHLNSFMYEPILDMSDRHLIRLYNEVKTL